MAEHKKHEAEEEIIPSEDPEVEAPTETVDEDNSEAEVSKDDKANTQEPARKHRFKRFLHTKKGKVLLSILILIVIAGVLFAIPFTRYKLLSLFVKKDVHIVVLDSSTAKPVSQATVSLGDKSAKTTNNGEVTLSGIPVGDYALKVTKKYYKDTTSTYEVPVLSSPKDARLQIVATGRQVIVSVVNKITQVPLSKAIISVNDTSATTDDKGMTTIVLPADKATLQGTVKLDGYNQSDITIKVTEQAGVNQFSLTPSGTVYYLSKQTGTINVMKSNLDGTAASVVIEGTGSESDTSTVLLATRDWKYMALSANRDPTQAGQLYLVNGQTGKLITIDEGNVNIQLIGWSGHDFIYQVNRNNKSAWEDKQQALKSYNAETGQLTTLDETTSIGTNVYDYQEQTIQSPYILEGKIVYVKAWSFGGNFNYAPTDKKPAIMSVNPDGSQKQVVKDFSMQHYAYFDSRVYEPQGIYFSVSIDNNPASYYAYEDSAVKNAPITTFDQFNAISYPTYLISPTGQKTFWFEPRDGKNALLIGDQDGQNSSVLTNQSDYTAYGWYTDKYVLLSKNGSELYIAAADKSASNVQPLKITNYHKPTTTFLGYGSGYGGQ